MAWLSLGTGGCCIRLVLGVMRCGAHLRRHLERLELPGPLNQACTHRGGVALAGHCRTGIVLVADAAHPQIGVCPWPVLGRAWGFRRRRCRGVGRLSGRVDLLPTGGTHCSPTAGTRPATTRPTVVPGDVALVSPLGLVVGSLRRNDGRRNDGH